METNRNDNFPVIQTLDEYRVPPLRDEVSANLTYLGWAPLGTRESEAKWKIMRINKVGTVTKSEFPNSRDNYEFAWSERATYAYSR